MVSIIDKLYGPIIQTRAQFHSSEPILLPCAIEILQNRAMLIIISTEKVFNMYRFHMSTSIV